MRARNRDERVGTHLGRVKALLLLAFELATNGNLTDDRVLRLEGNPLLILGSSGGVDGSLLFLGHVDVVGLATICAVVSFTGRGVGVGSEEFGACGNGGREELLFDAVEGLGATARVLRVSRASPNAAKT